MTDLNQPQPEDAPGKRPAAWQKVVSLTKAWASTLAQASIRLFRSCWKSKRKFDKWLEADSDGRVSTGFFNPNRRTHGVIILLAAVLTVFVYSGLVARCYRDLSAVFNRANVFDEMRAKMPRIFEQVTFEDEKESDKKMLYLFLQEMGIVSQEQSWEETIAEDYFSELYRIVSDDGKQVGFWYQRPNVALLPDMVDRQELGKSQPSWWPVESDKLRSKMAEFISAMLAGYPHAADGTSHRSLSPLTEFFSNLGGPKADPAQLRKEWEMLQHDFGPDFGRGFSILAGFQLQLTSEPASDEQILHLLYLQKGVHQEFDDRQFLRLPFKKSATGTGAAQDGSAPEGKTPEGKTPEGKTPEGKTLEGRRMELQKAEQFMSGILTRLRSHPAVKQANWWMTLCRGYEQFFMLFIAFWMVLLLRARGKRRKREERIGGDLADAVRLELKTLHTKSPEDRLLVVQRLQTDAEFRKHSIAKVMLKTCGDQLARAGEERRKENLDDLARQLRQNDGATRWSLVWMSRSLPAIGFVGTVHGISLAMMGADTLVRAGNAAEQATAVNLVAGNLGVAFSHTLIALVLGVILSWFSDRQAFRERALVSELERELGYLIDPIGFDATRLAGITFRPARPTAELDEIHRIFEERLNKEREDLQRQAESGLPPSPLEDYDSAAVASANLPNPLGRARRILVIPILVGGYFVYQKHSAIWRELVDAGIQVAQTPTWQNALSKLPQLGGILLALSVPLMLLQWLSKWLEHRKYVAKAEKLRNEFEERKKLAMEEFYERYGKTPRA